MIDKPLIIFDLETDGTNKDVCSPIQIGAIAVDPVKLQVIPNSEFYSWCRPDNLEVPDYYERNKATIDFHLRNYGMKLDQFIAKLRECPSEKQVFENFIEYLKKYHTKQSGQTIFSAPRLAGYNIDNFDLPILDRLCKKYGNIDKNGFQNIYFTRDTVDIMKVVILWLQYTREVKSYSMDTIREYFGMESGQAHDALFDVKQEAEILIRYFMLHKRFAGQIKFKDAWKKNKEEANVS